MDWRVKHRLEDFEDYRKKMVIAPIGNTLLALIFLFSSYENFWNNYYVLACIITACFLFYVYQVYHWRTPKLNTLILILYFSIALAEFFYLGLPGYDYVNHINDGEISKGIMFEYLLWLTPLAYFITRLTLGIPLIILWSLDRKLHNM